MFNRWFLAPLNIWTFSICQNGNWKLLFLITQLSQSLSEAGAIGFHEGRWGKTRVAFVGFYKESAKLAILLPSIHGPLTLLVQKNFFKVLQEFHKESATRNLPPIHPWASFSPRTKDILRGFTKNWQLAILPWASLSTYKTRDSNNGDWWRNYSKEKGTGLLVRASPLPSTIYQSPYRRLVELRT